MPDAPRKRMIIQVLGWLVWGCVAFLAISFCYGCRTFAVRGEGFQWATGMQAMFFTLLTVAFVVLPFSRLHLLWLTPLSFLGATYVCIAGVPILTSTLLMATRAFLSILIIGTGLSGPEFRK